MRLQLLYKWVIDCNIMVIIKGHEFNNVVVRDAYNRRGLQYKNRIITALKTLGLTEDDMDIPLETVAMRKAQASVSWYLDYRHLFFSYNGSSKFVENLAMVSQVIEYFIHSLYENKITGEQFLAIFEEDTDILEQRKQAREVLGVGHDSKDFETMHKNYKKLSKEYHPDMPG